MNDKKADILKCGRELFSTKGFKDTNIAEITKMAGIATGTFYNYYPSKDKLFMEIYLEENVKLKKEIMESVHLEDSPLNVMKEIMFLNLQGMASNPILKEWYNRDVFTRIEQSFREEKGLESVDFLYDSFVEIVKKWQREGKVRNDIEAEMIMAIFSSLVTIETHKEEIGIKYFPQVLEYLAEFTMKGLMDCSDKE
ncbi:TetR/AcrR family transcriptional regulator [Sinanaerobacter chloroacetimidivorans]|uniref:TetR/AcrR family transcriptional regulator n=1 Tax=Sinanaerobacter chloroacetimidivorans TaxID=2818044 RepID=A0A8J7W1X5_9FIRM|nr:TetR/AcrR family transcriptional regulator [Sinanaerobacter chloroacetimidivorans]MBR0599342.1 TetR/AcrR family transcriptional regulator [Sinanaerobacter chloroacetimidivorans]